SSGRGWGNRSPSSLPSPPATCPPWSWYLNNTTNNGTSTTRHTATHTTHARVYEQVSMPVFVSFSWVAAITRKRRSRQLETAEEEGVMVEEEDEESGQQQPQLNNRGAVMTEWTKGEATPLL